MTSTRSVPLMLVDDHEIWRGGVRALLETTEFKVVGEASSGVEAVEVAMRCHPRIVLLDIRMAGGDGFTALIELKKWNPRVSVMMLTTFDNPTLLARAVAGGASGYLLKGISREEILDALRAIARGDSLLSPVTLLKCLRGTVDVASFGSELFAPLTEREEEVLRLVSTGLGNREIATILSIAEGTVKTHVEHIIIKLPVSDRVQAAVWAARHLEIKDLN